MLIRKVIRITVYEDAGCASYSLRNHCLLLLLAPFYAPSSTDIRGSVTAGAPASWGIWQLYLMRTAVL